MTSLRSRIIQRIMRDARNAARMNIPIAERRQRIDSAARRAIRLPRGVSSQVVSANGVPADLLIPANAVSGRAILYLHGGAYVICSPATHRGLAGNIALASQAHLLLIDYRLAPENPFPAALHDALAGYNWLLERKFLPGHIAIVGDSAGGGLALATCLALREENVPLPAALALLSPWTDLTFSGSSIQTRANRDPILQMSDPHWMTTAYAGNLPLTHPSISPLFADLHGFPPTLVQVGSEEILLDDSVRLDEKARQAGVTISLEVWEGMWHVFQAFAPYLPESQQAISRIGEFLAKTL
jgi:epsilon-lactone hydrolase